MLKRIIKRDGSIEDFDASKLNKWSRWASEDLNDRVDWSSIVLHTVKLLGEEAKSQDLQKKLIATCLQTKKWSYYLMAGRLYSAVHRKELYGDKMPTVQELTEKLVSLDLMAPMKYEDDDYRYMNSIIDHDRDFRMAHFQIDQIRNKYSISNKITKEQYETPQFVFMRMAMALAENEPLDTRLEHLTNYYNHFSLARLNAPTPNYVNLGTKHNGYASCCLYTVDDNAASLAIGDHIAYTMTYMSAGVGGLINSRSMGDLVRGGVIMHKGKLPYFRSLAGAVKANLQGGRGGACTTYFSCFDPEVMTIIMLQNPRTTRDKQNRDIHFAMLYNRLFVKKVAKNEQMFVFNEHTAPDLNAKFFSDDAEGFEELYGKYEADDSFVKNYVSARDIAMAAGQQSHEVATLYLAQIDEMNRHTSFKEPIHSSNLCVAPETKVLTSEGHKVISSLKDQTVTVWNGENWSPVIVRKTNDSTNLIRIKTSQGLELTCTPYHRFYIQGVHEDETIMVEAHALQPKDKLISTPMPVIEGTLTLSDAYKRGVSCAHYTTCNNYTHTLAVINKQDKDPASGNNIVPTAEYTIESRLQWFAGLIDTTGALDKCECKDCQKILLDGTDKVFMADIVLMLQTLGVNASLLAVNTTDDDYDKFYELTVVDNGLQKLLELGIKLQYSYITIRDIDWSKCPIYEVIEVIDENRVDSTYCFEEPLRHMGVFNGILTGQCLEITQPTSPYQDMRDLYSTGNVGHVTFIDTEGVTHTCKNNQQVGTTRGYILCNDLVKGDTVVDLYDSTFTHSPVVIKEMIKQDAQPEVSLCSLAGAVVSHIDSDEEYESVCYYGLKMIDKCIHMSDYPLPHVGYTTKSRLNAGFGVLGLAHMLAKKGLKYDTQEGLNEIHRIFERHAYFVIKASLRLGKELGNAPWIKKTKWAEGWLPIDTYKKTVDELVEPIYQYDWESLRKEIIANGGIRNSSLIAHMPTESSSKASGVPNGVYPIRDLSLKKTDAENALDWCAIDNDIIEDNYQLAWEISSRDMINVYAVIQKFTDHSISADFYKDRSNGEELTTKEIIEEFINMVKYGVKSKYYQNTFTVKVEGLDTVKDSAINNKHECIGACSL